MNFTARIFIGINLFWLFLAASNCSLRAQTDASITADATSKVTSISSDQIEKKGDYKVSPSARPLFEYDRVVQNNPTINERKTSPNASADNNFLSISYQIPENRFFMEMLPATNGYVRILIHGTTNEVYEVMSKISLSETNWHPEQALHRSTNENQMYAIVPILTHESMMFFWARDWTHVDENQNGIPDWWEWENFGSNNVGVDQVYDGSGMTVRQAYVAHVEPNKIRFMLSAENFEVSNSTAKLHVDIYRGHPFSLAVLVDSTNFANAVWQPWKQDISIDLGKTPGWHEVRIGVRGRAITSQQTWKWVRFRLDMTPLKLAIINPTSFVTAGKYAQIKGESTKALSAISYDIVNAKGLKSNFWAMAYSRSDNEKPGVDRHTFECVDVSLAKGTNQITVKAEDDAGNPASTVFRIVLDPKSATNPPAVILHWPQDGTQISGNSFTCRGFVTDPNANIEAIFVRQDGSTNSASGVVEREGSFWIPNIPLRDGINNVSIVASNPSGLSTATNITVLKSKLRVTVDHLTAADTSVSGTINEPGYTIWVNGKKVKADLNGKWVANGYFQIRAHSNTTVFLQVRAIPDSDNDGNGIPENLNPASTKAVDTEATAIVESGTYVTSYFLKLHTDYLEPYVKKDGSKISASDIDVSWADCRGGKRILKQQVYKFGVTNLVITETLWPPTRWPQPLPQGICRTWSDAVKQWQTNNVIAPPPFDTNNLQHADIDYVTADGHKHVRRIERTQIVLSTGGQAIAGHSSLYDLRANAQALEEDDTIKYSKPVPSEKIRMGTHGNLGSDGHLWVVIPDGLN